MVRIIQLFVNDNLNKRLRVNAQKIDKTIAVNQTNADLYFNGVNAVWRDNVYLVDLELVSKYYDQLHQLSITNFIIFVYSEENEFVDDRKIEKISDFFLPINFEPAQLYASLILARKNLEGYTQTTLSRKLINTSVSEIEALISKSDQRLFWKNNNGMYVGANKHFLDDFSIKSVDELIGKTDHELLDENDAIGFQAYDNQIFKSGDFFESFEKEIQFFNGDKKWLSISKYPHYRDGVIIGLVGCYKIINDGETLGNNHLSEEKLLEVLMDNMPDTIYFKDKESRFVKINKAQADLIGVSSPNDAIGKTDFDFFNLEMAKDSFSDEQNILFEGEPVQRLEHLGTNDGKFRWMNSLKVPIKDEKGNAIGTVGISRDVSAMVETELKLKTERDILQLLIDHIPSPIFFKDEKSVFTRVNKSLVQLMGADSTDNLLGKTDHDFYSKDDADVFRADEEEIIKTGKPVINKIEKSKWSDDVILWVSTTKMPIRDEETGKIIGIVGISHDMTEQIKNEQQLEKAMQRIKEASNAKSNFLSNMSHEIRTPLNGIIGMAEILKMGELTDEQLKLVGIIKQSGHNLLSIINDILDLSKLESGKMKVDESELNLHNIVDEVVCMMDYAVSENNNELKVKIDPNIPEYLLGDSLKIKQVFLNLLSNATKFTRDGKIFVTLKYVGSSDSVHCIVFEVVDTGIGMSEDEIKVIFDPFIQADASTTRKFGGTGLGLSISKELIKMMGGDLKVNSAKGEGSTFYFELKLKKVSVNELNYI